jgi:hypothetical protein
MFLLGRSNDMLWMVSDPEGPTIRVGAKRRGRQPVFGSAAALTGHRVGRYVVLELLGKGGMGAVYRAYDPILDRSVALKLLLADQGAFSTAEARDRLLREGQAMARVSHPNIVKVHDVGIHGNDVYVAMDLVVGVTLKQWVDQSERSWREIVRVMRQAAEGLAAAHDVDLVHRDFKPGNVMIDGNGRAFVTDFGLARLSSTPSGPIEAPEPSDLRSRTSSSTSSALTSQLTQAGTVMGTPAYMAPEQHRNEAIDGRADQFAFCVTFYEALFGERPFLGSSPRELVSNVARRRFARITSRRRVPRWVVHVLWRGLRLEPFERYPTMHALLDELQVRRSRRRRLGLVAAAAATVAVMLLGQYGHGKLRVERACGHIDGPIARIFQPARAITVGAALERLGGRHAADTAALVLDRMGRLASAWTEASRQACLEHHILAQSSDESFDATTRCLDATLERIDALATRLERPERKMLDRAARATLELGNPDVCLTHSVAAETPVSDDMRGKIAGIWADVELGRLEAARIESLSLLEEASTSGDMRAVTEAKLLLARVYATSRRPGVETLLEEITLDAERGRMDRLGTEAWVALVELAATGDDAARFAAVSMDAEAVMVRADAPVELRARILDARARWHLGRGDNREAADLADRGRALLEPIQTSSVLANVLETLAEAHTRLGQLDRALAFRLQSVAQLSAMLGHEHPRVDAARALVDRALSEARI